MKNKIEEDEQGENTATKKSEKPLGIAF